jgi:hypothetical protein
LLGADSSSKGLETNLPLGQRPSRRGRGVVIAIQLATLGNPDRFAFARNDEAVGLI